MILCRIEIAPLKGTPPLTKPFQGVVTRKTQGSLKESLYGLSVQSVLFLYICIRNLKSSRVHYTHARLVISKTVLFSSQLFLRQHPKVTSSYLHGRICSCRHGHQIKVGTLQNINPGVVLALLEIPLGCSNALSMLSLW